jgi:4-amino-4-deoxy-L-arabinose transferase-like glycosyltransferase
MTENRERQYHLLLLAAATLLCLLPFVARPFDIDEPLFIWTARHLQGHPLDFYGFNIDWYSTESSAAAIIKNPPLASFYIALAAAIGGYGEVWLHLAFLLPALGVVLGTYLLARELSGRPLLAALSALLTPVFLASSATVMCDTMMLAFYVWAVYLWIRAVNEDSWRLALLSSALVAFCALTKYFGVSLIPLLFAYTVARKGKGREKLLALLLPVVILAGYQLWTKHLYGRGLLLDAASYASASQERGLRHLVLNLVKGLSFAGGCLLPALFFLPRIWGRKAVLAAIAAIPLLALLFSALSVSGKHHLLAPWAYYLQMALFAVAALAIFAVALADLARRRDAEALLLSLWVAGTFLFAAFVNWSTNGRSVLPMLPAVAVLLARRMGEPEAGEETTALRSPAVALPLLAAAAISLAVTWSDYTLASSAREAAQSIAVNFMRPGTRLIFDGHWGFQYYMQEAGAEPHDEKERYPRPLLLALPENNTNIPKEDLAQATPLQFLEFPLFPYLATMSPPLRASFYSSFRGELPYSFGNVPDEKYVVLQFP